MTESAQGGDDILIASKGGGKSGGSDVLYGDAEIMDGADGGADLFILGGNRFATIEDYNPNEGDRVAGALGKDYRITSISTTSSDVNEHQQIKETLNAILLKGKAK